MRKKLKEKNLEMTLGPKGNVRTIAREVGDELKASHLAIIKLYGLKINKLFSKVTQSLTSVRRERIYSQTFLAIARRASG